MTAGSRVADPHVEPLILARWSPRDGSAMPQEDLEIIFDAARWAPSAYSFQRRRFLYARRDTGDWQRFRDRPSKP